MTNKRAIVWEAGWGSSLTVRSYRPMDLSQMTRKQYADGSGDLIFEEYYTYGRRGHRYPNYRGFLGIGM